MVTLSHIPLGTVVYLRVLGRYKEVQEHTVKGIVLDDAGLRYSLSNEYTYLACRVFLTPEEAFQD